MRNIILQRILFVLLFSFVLSSCGGGGGSSDSSDSYSISTNQVNFTTTQNGLTPPTQYVSVNVNHGTVFLGIEQSGSFFSASFAITGDTTGQITVTPGSTNRTPGTYNGTITVIGCEDPFCGIQADGSPKTIRVSYTILPQPELSASPASLSFTEDEGIAPAGQVVSLVQNNGSVSSWSATVSYSGAVTGWLSLTPNTANNTIGVGVNPLGAGTYQATINVQYTFPSGSRNLSIPVSYTAVSVAQITPSSLSFFSTEGIAPGAQNITVGFGTTNPGWNATVQYTSGTGWLDLTPTGGNLNVQPQVRALGTYSANIIISYTFANGAESSAIIPVAYEVTQGVQPDLASVNLTAVEGEDPPAQGVNMSVLGGASVSNWSAAVEYTDGTSGWLAVNPLTGSSMPASLSIDAGIRVPGVYQANVIFSYTIGGVNGSTSVPVTYTVSPGVSLSTSTLNFTAREGKTPAVQTVDINYTGTGIVSWTTGMNPVASWLTLNPTSGASIPATISVEPAQMRLGNVSTTVDVSYDIGGITPTLPFTVNYEVLEAWATPVPANVNFIIDSTTTSANLSRTVTVGDLYADATGFTWTANSNVTWLDVTGSGGTDTGNIVTITLLEADLLSLNDGDTANITLTPDNPNITPLVIPVTVNFNVPSVTGVTPKVRFTNQPSEVILRGSGFDILSTEIISFGGHAAASYTVVSDTEIRLTPPAAMFAAAGTYHIVINEDAVMDLSEADLLVVDPPVYSATTIDLAANPKTLIHDPLRNTIFYTTDTGVYRLAHQGGATWSETSAALVYAAGICLTPDSSELLVTTATSYNNQLYHMDPDTLAAGSSQTVSFFYEFFTYVAALNNDVIKVIDTNQWGTMITLPVYARQNLSIYSVNAVVSENRDRLFFGGYTFDDPGYLYDASDDSTTTVLAAVNVRRQYTSMSEDGAKTLIQNDIYDADFTNLGSLDNTVEPHAAVLSPDGSRAYVALGDQLLTFDTSGTGGPFPQLGSAVTLPLLTGELPSMMLFSQDGSTLFIVTPNYSSAYPYTARLHIMTIP